MAYIQRASNECPGTALIEQSVRKALLLPTRPRSYALLNVLRNLSWVMPKLNDGFRYALRITIIWKVLVALVLNQLSDEFRALSMMLGTVGIMLHGALLVGDSA